jgi:hypothetical protein
MMDLIVPSLLHVSFQAWWMPQPPESHHTFGSGFILLGMLMVAETLSGGIWHQSRMRSMIFPATLVVLGWGMMAVTFVETYARLVHLSMGLPLVIGGWFEAQNRLGRVSRRSADLFIVPALFLAAVDTAGFHLTGPVLSGGYITHAVLAILAVVVGLVRMYQTHEPTSVTRGLALSFCLMFLGLDLYLDAVFL